MNEALTSETLHSDPTLFFRCCKPMIIQWRRSDLHGAWTGTLASTSYVLRVVQVERSTRRALLAAGATLLVYTVSVATHEGEFWPFSIFPMFSGAGKPWRRALMLEVPNLDQTPGWGPWTLDQLPGKPFPTHAADVSTNDLSKFVQLTQKWSDDRTHALRKLYASALEQGRHLLLLRADGHRTTEGAVSIALTGLVRFSNHATLINPALT